MAWTRAVAVATEQSGDVRDIQKMEEAVCWLHVACVQTLAPVFTSSVTSGRSLTFLCLSCLIYKMGVLTVFSLWVQGDRLGGVFAPMWRSVNISCHYYWWLIRWGTGAKGDI